MNTSTRWAWVGEEVFQLKHGAARLKELLFASEVLTDIQEKSCLKKEINGTTSPWIIRSVGESHREKS